MTERPASPAPAALVDELERLLQWSPADWDMVWSRTVDWLKSQQPSNGERGGGLAEPTDDLLQERKDDRQASRYYEEVRTIAARMLADTRRLNNLRSVFLPKQPRQIQGREMTLAQVAAEGWCTSCFRWDNTIKEREKSARGYHHKELCDLCHGFLSDHGVLPPIPLIQAKYGQLKNWTTKMVQEALEEHRRPKAKAS